MKSETKKVVTLLIVFSLLIGVSILTVVKTNIKNDKYQDFCEERNLRFDSNFRNPVCIK